jgi:hypothetical protein
VDKAWSGRYVGTGEALAPPIAGNGEADEKHEVDRLLDDSMVCLCGWRGTVDTAVGHLFAPLA